MDANCVRRDALKELPKYSVLALLCESNFIMADPNEDRTNMTRHPCSPENSILEGDLELAVIQNTLDELKVMETTEGFYVVVLLKWAEGKEWYLTTRRDRFMPKVFKDLKRLNDHIREAYPTDSFTLFRNQELPPRPKTVKPPASSKAKR